MNVENCIEAQYRELMECSEPNAEYADLYKAFTHPHLREILTTLHHDLILLFKRMNDRLPTGECEAHFWADESRELIRRLDIVNGLFGALKETPLAFNIDSYYADLFLKCRDFLRSSGGSKLPPNMSKIDLYYTIPIFTPVSSVTVPHEQQELIYQLKLVGEGSYANVFKYKDTFYNRFFILKRAKKGLDAKELARFRREYDVMSTLSSPYVVEVYNYNSAKNEYIMEYMDDTLDGYISSHNSTLDCKQRKSIVRQILRAFEYIHSKNQFHRDISPKNILVKLYEDTIVIKIADFGLVKIPNSSLTSVNTEPKGYFNDPILAVEGFNTYNIEHEIYALTRIVYFVMTGKMNTNNIVNQSLKKFVEKGLNPDSSKRFKNVSEMQIEFGNLT